MGTPRKSGRQRKVLDYKRLAKGLSFDDDSKSSEDEEIKFVPLKDPNAREMIAPIVQSDSILHSQQGSQASTSVSKIY